MTTVSGISSTAYSAASTSATTQSSYDSNEFMQILLAQLKNQNPLDPMDNQEMMSQMVSLNTLQEMQNISSNLEQLSGSNTASLAASLIGKNVKATLDDGTTITGLVDSTSIISGIYYLNIGEKQITLSQIVSISQASSSESSTNQSGEPPSSAAENSGSVEKVAYV